MSYLWSSNNVRVNGSREELILKLKAFNRMGSLKVSKVPYCGVRLDYMLSLLNKLVMEIVGLRM